MGARRVFLAAVLVALTGCSTSGTSVLVGDGGPRAATEPASVALLVAPPQRPHEVIALVEGVAATDDYFTKAKTEAAAIKAMKDEAARIGAHAVVLTGKDSAPYGQAGYTATNAAASATGFYATTISSGAGWEKITFSGTAIRYTDTP